MKNPLLILLLILFGLSACQAPAATEEAAAEAVEAPDYATFNKRVEILRAFIKAHCDEDIEAQSALLADTLRWSPPIYNGNEWLGKAEFTEALKGYHDAYENITFTEGIPLGNTLANGYWAGSAFPQEDATNEPDAIRVYGTWTVKHSESGKDIGVKWFGIGFVNEAGKIGRWTEYWDAHGLAAQIAAE